MCEYALEGMVGTNAHGGGEGWYSFTVPEAGILTVSFPEFEMIQIVGECGMDEYGSFTDFIVAVANGGIEHPGRDTNIFNYDDVQ